MRNKSAVPKTYATEQEIEAAVAALTTAELAKLGASADFYVRALAARGAGISGEDLVQEAIARTFNGKRKWPTDVKFNDYVLAVVRSIASAALKKLKGEPVVDASDESLSDELIEKLVVEERHQARVAADVERIEQLFHDDDQVLLVMEDLKDDMSGPEIQRDLGLTKTEYETAMKRLRRRARAKE